MAQAKLCYGARGALVQLAQVRLSEPDRLMLSRQKLRHLTPLAPDRSSSHGSDLAVILAVLAGEDVIFPTVASVLRSAAA